MDAEQKRADKGQNRQAANQDFARSLHQLENILENEPITQPAEPVAPITPEGDTETEAAHRFGGSLLDAIPLAHQLSLRLSSFDPPADA